MGIWEVRRVVRRERGASNEASRESLVERVGGGEKRSVQAGVRGRASLLGTNWETEEGERKADLRV